MTSNANPINKNKLEGLPFNKNTGNPEIYNILWAVKIGTASKNGYSEGLKFSALTTRPISRNGSNNPHINKIKPYFITDWVECRFALLEFNKIASNINSPKTVENNEIEAKGRSE